LIQLIVPHLKDSSLSVDNSICEKRFSKSNKSGAVLFDFSVNFADHILQSSLS
jgi:hypothetical protein